jgi:Flp pilus assembly protein TadD
MKKCVWVAILLALIGFEAGFAQTTEPAANVSGAVLVRQLLDEARDALRNNNPQKADEAFSRLVQMAREAYAAEDVASAEWTLNQVLDVSDYLDAHFTLAELYRQTDRPFRAIQHYDRYIEANPTDTAARFGRGTSYLLVERYSLAIRDLEYLIEKLAPNHVLGLSNLALAFRGQAVKEKGNLEIYSKALDYMRRAVEAAAADETQQAQLPDYRYRLAQFSSEYQQILSRSRPESVNYAETIALFRDAMRESQTLIRKDPTSLDALAQVGQCFDGLTEVYLAEADLKPNDPEPYLKLAEMTEQRKALANRRWSILSLGYLKKAIELNPKDAKNYVSLAQAHVNLGLLGDARQAVEQATAIEPENETYKKILSELTERIRTTTQPATKPKSEPSAESPQ